MIDFVLFFSLEQAAASKWIFTLLGPLFIRSQRDDLSAVAGALVADITTSGIKDTFGGKKTTKKSINDQWCSSTKGEKFQTSKNSNLFYCLLYGPPLSPLPFAV